MNQFSINGRIIGPGHPAYIIAEMSANHAGSIERAKEIIHAAKDSGADCIKIQTYTPDTMTIDCHNDFFDVKSGTWEGENLYSLYGKAYTPWEWQADLKKEADKVGIDFLSTPFDNTSVDFLEDLGLQFYKIASFELVDIPLIQYVASKGKLIIMSTGMATKEEITEAVNAVKRHGNPPLALLKCSSAYPADPHEMHLSTIIDMQKQFQLPVGLSDHSLGSLSSVTAVALGACIIEKHFCISREIENPDASFSMTPQEFKAMVTDIRNAEASIGIPTYGISKQEETSVVFRRSLFAVADIKRGDVFTNENIRVIRPGYGMKPKYIEDMLGLTSDIDIKRGTPLQFSVLKKDCILFLTNNENTDDIYKWLQEKDRNIYRFTNKVTLEMVQELDPSFLISFNYIHMIPKDVIDYMNHKAINLHISFLPYNRGFSPNFFSFCDNTPKGVTIHLLDEGLDTGDILVQKEVFFDEEKETFSSTYESLLYEIKELFKLHWDEIKNGRLIPQKQVGSGTYHTSKDLHAIQEQIEFEWSTKISDFKKLINK